jgi:Predicted membrane protein (DUF2127)
VHAFEAGGERWYRCVRCDSWLPLPRPEQPLKSTPPGRDQIELTAAGEGAARSDRAEVDRDRPCAALSRFRGAGGAVFLFASHELRLRHLFYRVANGVQGSADGPTHSAGRGFFTSLRHVFDLSSTTLYAVAAAAAAYALLEGVEAVGLWLQKRWAEYLTFAATIVFIPTRSTSSCERCRR